MHCFLQLQTFCPEEKDKWVRIKAAVMHATEINNDYGWG